MRFEDFLAAELDGLGRFARVLTGDRQEAHDLLADTLEQGQRRWRQIAVLEYPAAYVRQMLINRFLSGRRRWSARMIRVVEHVPETAVDGGQSRVVDRDQLHKLLESLPKQQRVAVVLRYYLDQTDADIAVALGCSQGSARTYVSRGLARLRVRLDVPDRVPDPHDVSTSEQL